MNLFFKKKLDFLGVGDILTDAFIDLQDADVHCDINNEHCTISMRFGDKIPYKSAKIVRGVGNSANATVSAVRLGLSADILSYVGNDQEGREIIKTFKNQKIPGNFLEVQNNIATNYHYVLRYGPERTILVKHEPFQYQLPEKKLDAQKPVWIYFTSLAKESLDFHHQFVTWLEKNPEVKFAFQPGTFQLELGTQVLADMYRRTDIFFCNKEEAQRVLGIDTSDFKILHAGIRALGPKMVVITDGPKGMTASEHNDTIYFLPMYSDPKPPVDRTGAGDACSSTIVVALQLGLSLREAMMWGPINSMSVVQYIGAQEGLLTREQLQHYLATAPADYQVTEL